MTGQEMAMQTIEYLGGAGRLKAMTGATNLGYDQDGSFKFQFKGCKKANIVKFILAANDTYTIEFYKYNRKSCECKTIKTIEDAYFDQLKDVFESETGLYLTF